MLSRLRIQCTPFTVTVARTPTRPTAVSETLLSFFQCELVNRWSTIHTTHSAEASSSQYIPVDVRWIREGSSVATFVDIRDRFEYLNDCYVPLEPLEQCQEIRWLAPFASWQYRAKSKYGIHLTTLKDTVITPYQNKGGTWYFARSLYRKNCKVKLCKKRN